MFVRSFIIGIFLLPLVLYGQTSSATNVIKMVANPLPRITQSYFERVYRDIFYENKKPAFLNLMNENGIEFYANLFKHAEEQNGAIKKPKYIGNP